MKFDIRETARERVILCAHRGIFGGNIPCNTIASFDFAIAEGADMVELDVTKSADGELFVFHPGMERRQFCRDVSIRKMNAAEVRELKLCNVDGAGTELGVNTLDEVLEHLKDRCYINIDKFGDCPADIIACVKRHDMKDQIILKCSPREENLAVIEAYAPDIQFLPVIKADNGCHEMMKRKNINYIGSELLFTSEEDETASEAYRETLRRDGKLTWVNAIVYDYRAVLAAGHSDDAAILGDPEFGWGWCADRFDIIQTDWIGSLSRYLEKTGRRYRK
ncbi:MAG: glycerophosphodiester phosphodiesterase family protein [Clostridia bacterium]|nr:glycerophosphodiester phosphodiesterase family protein [Clostridia bacterium]MBQ3957121.1 glycerophosphodiester phosphodiesterase family protein [Clostridia bacterium]MBR4185969.1 glycerophosphodiester phosphodiesterase family protein [Clostridia bacterium]